MKNRLLFEKVMLSVAPAVAKYHLELQLNSKGKGESDFIMHRDTARYIAEDCADNARTLVEEMEQQRQKSNMPARKARMEENGAADHEEGGARHTSESAVMASPTSTAAKTKNKTIAPTNGSVKKG